MNYLEPFVYTHATFFLLNITIFNTLIGRIVKLLWENAGANRKDRFNLQTAILGRLEAGIYYILWFSFLVSGFNNYNLLAIMGAWLTLKSLPAVWKVKAGESNFGPERYNIYLVGNLLNIISSFIAAFSVFLSLHKSIEISLLPTTMWTMVLLFFSYEIRTNKSKSKQ